MGVQCSVMSSASALASLSAVACARGLRSQDNLTALTVCEAQCANNAMTLAYIQPGDEVPQVRHVARHVRRPSGVTIRQRLRRRHVLSAVRVARKVRAIRSDIETMRVHATIEGLRGERMDDGNQGHVRLLAKGEPQAKRAMRGQADEKVGRRCAVFLRIFVRSSGRGCTIPSSPSSMTSPSSLTRAPSMTPSLASSASGS